MTTTTTRTAAGGGTPTRPRPPGSIGRVWLVLAYHLRILRRTWQGSAITTLGGPVLFLAALGLGLGTLVDDGQGGGSGASGLAGASYAAFAGTGLLAATAMQTAVSDCSWPVRGAIMMTQTYAAMLATPLRPVDLVLGQLAAVAMRLTVAAAVFAGMLAVFGVSALGAALAGVPVAVLVGVAHGAPVMAVAASATRDDQLPIMFRFVIMPLFLLSGTFFPIDRLPALLHPVAWLSPLWHGVEVTRTAVLGIAPPLPVAVHLAVLVAVALLGIALAARAIDVRLRT